MFDHSGMFWLIPLVLMQVCRYYRTLEIERQCRIDQHDYYTVKCVKCESTSLNTRGRRQRDMNADSPSERWYSKDGHIDDLIKYHHLWRRREKKKCVQIGPKFNCWWGIIERTKAQTHPPHCEKKNGTTTNYSWHSMLMALARTQVSRHKHRWLSRSFPNNSDGDINEAHPAFSIKLLDIKVVRSLRRRCFCTAAFQRQAFWLPQKGSLHCQADLFIQPCKYRLKEKMWSNRIH